LRSRSNALSSWITADPRSPWIVSGSLHFALAALLVFLLFERVHQISQVEIAVIDAPAQAKAVNISARPEPKKEPKKAPRAVFGQSRKAITSEAPEAVESKAGNTLAKDPDKDLLKPEDPDSLPVPTEEYMVTQMPELAQEVRIPYPSEAKRKGAEGAVVMDLLIDSSGKVRDAQLVQGPEGSLNAAAMQAIHGFLFKPARIQDKAVAVKIRYAYRFVLER
jgi:protein TonB